MNKSFIMPRRAQFLKNLQRFRLVTFDITGTLLRFRIPPAEQYAKTAAQFGVTNLDQQHLTKHFHKEFKVMSQKHPNFGHTTPNMNWQEWWIQLVENVFRGVEPTIPQATLQSIAETLLREYRTGECWTHVNGNMDLLQKVKDANKRIGVISNHDPGLRHVLRDMEIEDKFDFVLTSYDSGILKPDCRIFEIALERCQAQPHEALHIGNLYEVDYIGARNSGWCSLLIATSGLKTTKMNNSKVDATHIYASLADMVDALETRDIVW